MNLQSRRGRVATLTAAVALSAVIAACTGVANLHIPVPPSTAPTDPSAPTTAAPNLSGVNLPPVAAGTPTTVVLTPGGASLSGIVTGPTGVVAGATVLVERLVGDTVGAKTVPTGADGTWKLPGILGGRYRIRAWRAPDLALTTPQILLLGGKENQNLSLTLMPYNGQTVTATVVPSPPQVGQVTTLIVQAMQQTVGGDGVVRGAPLPGANVFVFAAGNIVLAGTNPGTTDAGGRMALSLGCSALGPAGLSASINGLTTFPLMIADCAVFIPPTTTSTTVKPPTSSVP
jgi:hypothetical protein